MTDKFSSTKLIESATRLKPGQPCGHPGCASHLSRPCEGCGRYAAGMANGPDVDQAKEYIKHLGRVKELLGINYDDQEKPENPQA